MKFRNGFVSNSSSSSFVVSDKHYKDVFDLAVEMIKLRDVDYAEYDYEDGNNEDGNKEWKRLKDVIISARETMDPNTPITFPTTNYHTFILKHDDNFLVSTCNNHIEFNYMKGFSHSSKHKDIIEDFDCDTCEDFEDKLSSMTWFWYPHLNVFAKEIPYVGYEFNNMYECTNNKCYTNSLILLRNNKEVMCPLCKTISPVNPKDLELIHQYNIKTPIERIHESMAEFEKTEEAWALDLRLDFADKLFPALRAHNMDLKTLSEKTGIKEKTLEKIIHFDYNFKINEIAKIGYVLGVKFEVK